MKTERFEMRLDQGTIDRLDNWRSRQGDLPSRAEAVRRLVEAGLNTGSEESVKISDGEKLVVKMLSDLYKHLKVKSDIDPKFVDAVLFGGHYWALRWEYPGLLHSHEDDNRVVSEVVDILEMWSFIEGGYNKLSAKERNIIEKEFTAFGAHAKFLGFDGNNEVDHLSVARFLIDELGRFSSFKNRDLNSHKPTVNSYRRMLTVFEPMRATLTGGELSASQIIGLLKARVHPDRRKS